MGKLFDTLKEKLTGMKFDNTSNLDDGIPDDAIRDKQLRSLIRQKTHVESQLMKEQIKKKLVEYQRMRDKESFGSSTMMSKVSGSGKVKKVNYLKSDHFKKVNL
jgi:hypothetical protein